MTLLRTRRSRWVAIYVGIALFVVLMLLGAWLDNLWLVFAPMAAVQLWMFVEKRRTTTHGATQPRLETPSRPR